MLVIVGSSFQSRNIRNSFNWSERAEMTLSTLPKADRIRLKFLPVRDYYGHALWNADVRRQVSECVSARERIALVDFKKDHTTYYLDNFPDWRMVEIESSLDIDATDLRKLLFEAETAQRAAAEMGERISTSISQFLNNWSLQPVYGDLKKNT